MSGEYLVRPVGPEELADSSDLQVFEQTIRATPAQIFEVFADAKSWPEWVEAITHAEWTSPPPYGAGSTRDVTLRGGILLKEEFVLWEEGERMFFTITAMNRPLFESFAEEYKLTDNGDGSCSLRWSLHLRARWFVRPLVAMIRPFMTRSNQASLRALARYVEGRYSSLGRATRSTWTDAAHDRS